MQRRFVTYLKSGLAIMAIAALASACRKENDSSLAPLEQKDELAAVPVRTSTVITGNFGNPADPSTYGTLYLNLATRAISSTPSGHVAFTSTNNSFVQPRPGYTLRYVVTTVPFANLKITTFPSANTSNSLGMNTAGSGNPPNGWYNYIPPGGVTIIPNFYILVTPTAGGTSYAFKFTNVTSEGTATNNRGIYTIQGGVINNN